MVFLVHCGAEHRAQDLTIPGLTESWSAICMVDLSKNEARTNEKRKKKTASAEGILAKSSLEEKKIYIFRYFLLMNKLYCIKKGTSWGQTHLPFLHEEYGQEERRWG